MVREAAEFASNWRNQITLNEFLKEKGIPGIAGIDTRKLTKLIRKEGTLKGILAAETADKEELLHHLRSVRLPVDQYTKFPPLKHLQAQEMVNGLYLSIMV